MFSHKLLINKLLFNEFLLKKILEKPGNSYKKEKRTILFQKIQNHLQEEINYKPKTYIIEILKSFDNEYNKDIYLIFLCINNDISYNMIDLLLSQYQKDDSYSEIYTCYLMYLLKNELYEILELFIKYGFNINGTITYENYEYNLLSYLLEIRQGDISNGLIILLQNNIDINKKLNYDPEYFLPKPNVKISIIDILIYKILRKSSQVHLDILILIFDICFVENQKFTSIRKIIDNLSSESYKNIVLCNNNSLIMIKRFITKCLYNEKEFYQSIFFKNLKRTALELNQILYNLKDMIEIDDKDLFRFIKEKNLEKIKNILDTHKNLINIKNMESNTPLMVASEFQTSDTKLIDLLIKYNPDKNIINNTGLTALHIASLFDNYEIIPKLITERNIDIKDVNGNTPLMLTAIKRNYECAKKLLSSNYKINVNSVDKYGDTPLIQTMNKILIVVDDLVKDLSKNSNDDLPKFVDLLIEKGADKNKTNKNNDTALHAACKNNIHEIIPKLITDKNINMKNKNGYTPLMIAIFKRNYECIKSLLSSKYNLDINMIDKNGNTPLMMTIMEYEDLSEFMDLFIEKGANKDLVNKNNDTALHIACKNNLNEVIPKLITEKNINMKNKDGYTPLMIAINERNYECIKTLLSNKYNLDINIVDKKGNTPLMMTIMKDEDISEFIDLFIEKGTNKDLINKNQSSALHIACKYNNYKIISKLITEKNINMKNKDGYTPLMIAINNKNYECIKSLLSSKHNLDINIVNNDGNSPLMMALMKYEEDLSRLIDLFIKKGSNKDLVNKNQSSILHIACENNLNEVIPKLITEKNINIKNKDGYTPLMIAINNKNYECLKSLLSSKYNLDINTVDKNGNTPLINAIINFKDLSEHIDLFIEKGANKDLINKNKSTALHIACENNLNEVIPKLITEKNINMKNKDGYTPIMIAINKKNKNDKKNIKSIIELLSSTQFNEYYKTNNNNDLISILTFLLDQHVENDKVYEILIPNIYFGIKQFKKLLNKIINNNSFIKAIIKCGISIHENNKNKNITSPLIYSVCKNYFDLSKSILNNYQGRVNEVDENNNYCLFHTMEKEKEDYFNLFLESGKIDFEKTNSEDLNPLEYSLKLKKTDMTKKLLKKYIEKYEKNNNNYELLNEIIDNKYYEISKELSELIKSEKEDYKLNYQKIKDVINSFANNSNNDNNNNYNNNYYYYDYYKYNIPYSKNYNEYNHDSYYSNDENNEKDKNNSKNIKDNFNNISNYLQTGKISNKFSKSIINNNNDYDDDDDDDDLILSSDSSFNDDYDDYNDKLLSENNFDNNDNLLSENKKEKENIYNGKEEEEEEEEEEENLDNFNEILLAYKNENEELLQILIENEFDINELCNDGSTPLLFSLKNKKFKSAKLLIKNKADITIPDNKGETAISYTLKKLSKEYLEILELLLPYMKMNQTYPPDGLTPLQYLIKYNHIIDGVPILSKAKDFNINEIINDDNDGNGNNLLFSLIKMNSSSSSSSSYSQDNLLNVIKIVLSNGGNPNQIDKENKVPLMYAIEQENFELIKLLIENNADIRFKMPNGETPLLYACKKNKTKIAKELLKNDKIRKGTK
ncbi:ankyrin [Anaeromyces robustus]|uniref:Ankyrin n=1 Tax=Anaeromyces robustus TaxID=1754192 RepID=A0A1Y1XLS8_9FUNG|nr:ankyrin [Anaeromyces robustus]|eukprot:ORX86697.1 ankyrin [Anaeromyces robustus]